MRYFVLTQAGRYGPADAALLSQWAIEGRIEPGTILEDEATGQRTPASDLPGLNFSTFGSAPLSNQIVPTLPAGSGSTALQPLPPRIVSNYRRPDYVPPLFLAHEVDGRKEHKYAFLLAAAAPVVAVFHIYGVLMALGGIYCGVVAFRRGHPLGMLGAIVSVIAVPLALYLRYRFAWSF